MRYLITGGSGLIGSGLVLSLAQHGHEVIVLTRNPEGVILPSEVRAVRWDGRTAEGWGELADAADCKVGIINLAGEPIAGRGLLDLRWTAARKELIRQSRLLAGQAVTQAVQAAVHKPQLVLQASAVGYYGCTTPDLVTEDAAPGTDFLARLCVDWEDSTAPVEALGVRRVTARLGVALSHRGGALPRQMLLFRWFAGGRLGTGAQPYPWLHLEDAVSALQFLAQHPTARGVYNLVAPERVSNDQFGRTLARAMRRPYWLPAPAWALRLLLGEASSVLLDGQSVSSERLIALGYRFKYPLLHLALQQMTG